MGVFEVKIAAYQVELLYVSEVRVPLFGHNAYVRNKRETVCGHCTQGIAFGLMEQICGAIQQVDPVIVQRCSACQFNDRVK